MASRQTNLALLVLLLFALITGFTSFALGTDATIAVVIGHGVVALGIVLLAPWKTAVARRSMRRRGWAQGVSLTLAMLTFVALASGLLHASGLVLGIGPFTVMQVHVGSGVGAVVVVLVHTMMRPVRARRVDLTRRNFLRGGALIGAAAVLYLAFEQAWRVVNAPGRRRRFTGSHEVGSDDPAAFPTTQWLNDRVQHLETDSYRVTVLGRVHTAKEITAKGDSVEATLDCTGGWHTTQAWSGTRLDRLIGVAAGRSILVRSITGYWRRFPIEDAGRLLLATHAGGRPLSDGHGAPVRLVAPDRRGFWWVKWVSDVTVDDVPWWWQPPLPTA